MAESGFRGWPQNVPHPSWAGLSDWSDKRMTPWSVGGQRWRACPLCPGLWQGSLSAVSLPQGGLPAAEGSVQASGQRPGQWPPVAAALLTFDLGCRREAREGLLVGSASPQSLGNSHHLFKPPSSEGTCHGLADHGSRDSGQDSPPCSGHIFASAKKKKKTDSGQAQM